MTTHRELAARLIRDGEGLRLKVYDDASGKPVTAGSVLAGHPSIGYGRNLAGQGISESEADAMLAGDLGGAEEVGGGFIGGRGWAGLSGARRARPPARGRWGRSQLPAGRPPRRGSGYGRGIVWAYDHCTQSPRCDQFSR